ncbi:MAG: DUF192 domain-containing protein, partial [Brevundimonas sp.]
MPLNRRLMLSFAVVALATAACASEKPPLDPRGEPMEQLTIVTDSGRHTFWMEIADDDAERQRG